MLLILALVFSFLLFYNEQTFEEEVDLQKANNETLIQTKTTVGRTVRHRKKSKKEKTKSEDESGHEKTTKESEPFLPETTTTTRTDEEISAFFCESTPERANGITESSEEERPILKQNKKKSKDKGKTSRSNTTETSISEQEPPRKPVVEDVVVEEVLQKTESEPVVESEQLVVAEEVILPEQEPSIKASPSSAASKESKKSKASKDKNLTAGMHRVKLLALIKCSESRMVVFGSTL